MKELLITSSVLILALVALRFLFRNQISRRLQYALWLLVVLRLLIPISLLPRASFSVLSGTQALTERWEQTTTLPELHLPELPNAASTETSLELTPSEAGTAADTSAPAQPAATQDAQGSSFSLSWRLFARAMWILGAATVLMWLLAVNLRFRQQLLKSRRAVEVPGCPLPVYVTDTVVSPCLFGLFRPAVYLTPKALESEESLRHVLTHELCHYRHGDHIWALVRSVLLAVYWFDPLVWLAASLSRTDGELACDEAAIRLLGSDQRLAYGKTLVDMVAVQRSPSGILCTATTMTSGKRSLKERLNRIVRRPKVVFPAVVAVVLLAAVCVACTFTSASKTTDADSASSESSGETATSQVTYTLSKVENGVETPINDPDGFLAGEIFFDAMVKSSAAPAVELPDTYYVLTETETPTDGSEARQSECQVFRLNDGIVPTGLGTPVLQHGEQYTAIHYELMARLEAAANRLPGLPATNPDPAASAHQDVLIDYADEKMVIFHGYFGLFVYDRVTGAVTKTLDLDTAIGTSQVYKESGTYAEVAVSRDGRVLRVAARSGEAIPVEALWIDTATWTGGMGPWAELRQPFSGGYDSATTAEGETISVDLGSGLIGEVQLVIEGEAIPLFTGIDPAPTDLDDAITAAVRSKYDSTMAEGEYPTEAHWLLGTEENEDGTVIAYCNVVYLPFSNNQGTLEPSEAGISMPMVFTFQRDENSVLQLTEMWETELGSNYIDSVRERFLGEIADLALALWDDPQGVYYLQAMYQSCYDQAIRHFHVDPTPVIAAAIDQLTATMDQWNELFFDDDVHRTARYYGDYTLMYIYSQFLQGGQTGSRGKVMEQLLQQIHPDEMESLESVYVSPQATFDEWKDYVVRMADGNGVEWYAGNRTATLLLNALDYQIPLTMGVYEEIDRLVDEICSTPSAASSVTAYIALHPLEYQKLLAYNQYGDYTLRYCFHRFLRGDVYGVEDGVLWTLMEELLGDENIGVVADSGQDYFNQWYQHVMNLYDQNALAYFYEYAPKSYVLLDVLGYTQVAADTATDGIAEE